jgi:phenylpyruvate tautomerase PptA (4-oxalocrotonate tautomerase family)
LHVELLKPRDKKTRADLVKALAQHIADVTGCPGPDA